MLRNWRSWLLLALLLGPILAYMGFGALWLWEHGWILPAGAAWILSGIVFSVLASRWTKSSRELLPPIDWDAPQTFSPHDRKAWELVQEEATHGDEMALESLTEFDIYIDTGRRLARRLAAHYHPLSTDPIENVPIVELLTALELASEDLTRLSRQVPGGDIFTPAHLKQAVKAANYLQRANDLYGYLLPLFNPMTGLVRLGTQHLMVKPAWKNMQQNLLRWFFRAYVNRLGTHLIELYSGRLVIGSERYRRLTRKAAQVARAADEDYGPLSVAVVGSRPLRPDRYVESLEAARTGDLGPVKAQLAASGHVETAADRLQSVRWVAVPGYTTFSEPSRETSRDRSTRRDAVAAAVESDLLLLVIDPARPTDADQAFARDWSRWYAEHPNLEAPPALVVIAAEDAAPGEGGTRGSSAPPADAVQRAARVEQVRGALAPAMTEVIGPDPGPDSSIGSAILAPIASLLHRAERSALIRHLHRESSRSKARRLFEQVGRQGKSLWSSIRSSRERVG